MGCGQEFESYIWKWRKNVKFIVYMVFIFTSSTLNSWMHPLQEVWKIVSLLQTYYFSWVSLLLFSCLNSNNHSLPLHVYDVPSKYPYSISFWVITAKVTQLHVFQTTYENFRYRADNRINVYNRGCANNFLEVFCTEVKPSRNNFRAFVQEEAPRPSLPRTPEGEDEGGGDPRTKVEDDLEIGEDLLKISQRRNIDEIDDDIRSRGSNGPPRNNLEIDSALSVDIRAPTIRADTRHSSWGRRSGSWEIAQEVIANSTVTESRGYVTSREARQWWDNLTWSYF